MVTMSDSLMYPVMCNFSNTAIGVKKPVYFCRIVNHLAQIVTNIQKYKTNYLQTTSKEFNHVNWYAEMDNLSNFLQEK